MDDPILKSMSIYNHEATCSTMRSSVIPASLLRIWATPRNTNRTLHWISRYSLYIIYIIYSKCPKSTY